MNYTYALEQLFTDQDPDFASEIVPATLSWLDPSDTLSSIDFTLREHTAAGEVDHQLQLTWNRTSLATHAGVLDAAKRWRSGKTIHFEDHTKIAAYGLAFVAITLVLKRQVLSISVFEPPDLIYDDTTASRRGVEVAGRGKKGYAAFKRTLEGHAATAKTAAAKGKREKLKACAGLVEGYISLWCREPLVAWWERAV